MSERQTSRVSRLVASGARQPGAEGAESGSRQRAADEPGIRLVASGARSRPVEEETQGAATGWERSPESTRRSGAWSGSRERAPVVKHRGRTGDRGLGAGGGSRCRSTACGRRRTWSAKPCSPRCMLVTRSSEASVLDLYAGTGAYGIESISRGAADAVVVERERTAADVVTENVATVGFADRGGPARGRGPLRRRVPPRVRRRSTSFSSTRRMTPPRRYCRRVDRPCCPC